ncbi:MAG: hypothetical protein KRP56_03000 [Candidatus Methanogranum gryphiswaldense]|nr:MAG: hypothetical protein KRP56_03000 [Candidatus Methanogranum sp. U3.2.1]
MTKYSICDISGAEATEMRTPQEIVMTIAYSLKDGKKGDEYSVADISKSTQLHYMTTSDYLSLIEYIQENIPKINKIDSRGKARIVIINEMESDYSQKEKIMLTMFDKAAFSKDSALVIKNAEDCIDAAISEKLVLESIKGRYYLTTNGIMEAAKFAEKRAEKMMDLSVKSKKECLNYELEDKEEVWHKCNDCLENGYKQTGITDTIRCLPSSLAA